MWRWSRASSATSASAALALWSSRAPSRAAPLLLRDRRAPAASPPRHLVPLALAALGWVALARVNRAQGWFRLGEVICWDAVMLVVLLKGTA